LNHKNEHSGTLWWLSKRRFYWALQLVILLGLGYLGMQLVNCYVQSHSLRGTFYCFTGLKDPALAVRSSPKDSLRITEERWEEAHLVFPPNTTEVLPEDISDLEAKWYQKYGLVLKVLLMVLVLSAFIFYEIYRNNRRKLLLQREDQAPADDAAQQVQPELPELYSEAAFEQASARLLARPTPQDPGYLVLIEKQSQADHLAMLVDQLLFRLREKGLNIERYFYDQNPLVCWKKPFVEEKNLQELGQELQGRQLVLIGDTTAFFDPLHDDLLPWTEMLEVWQRVVVVSTLNPLSWSQREEILARQYTLLPASMDAFGHLAGIFAKGKNYSPAYWKRRNQLPPPPQVEDEPTLEDIARYFDTRYHKGQPLYEAGSGHLLFQWLCATALSPELKWDLTLRLGQALSEEDENLRSLQSLFKLVSLPCFRQGQLPDALRLQLVDKLEEGYERRAREVILQVLQSQGEALAAEPAYQLQLALHKAHLEPRISSRLRLMQQARDFALTQEIQDPVLLKELDELPLRDLAQKLPDTLRQAVFYQGKMALGTRPWVRASMVLMLLFLIYTSVGPGQLQQLEQFAGKDYYLATKADRMRYHTYLGNVYLADSNDYQTARQHYLRAIHYRNTSGDSLYLKADYNLAVLDLKSGLEDQASQQFAQVQQKGDSLLAAARIAQQPSPADSAIKEIVARSNLNQGLIALRGGDIEGARQKIGQADALLEARYYEALVLLSQPRDSVQAQQYLPLKQALQEFRNIYRQNPGFFRQQDTLYLQQLLDSLQNVYQDTGGNVLLEEIRAAISGDTLPVIPTSPRDTLAIQLLDGKDIVLGKQIGPVTAEKIYLVRLLDQGDFGFVDAATQELIARGFDYALSFSQQRAAVKKGPRWGFIDPQGEMVIPLRYEDVRDFMRTHYGFVYATVKKGNKWGAIDRYGRELVPFISEKPLFFSLTDPLAAVLVEGKYGYVDPNGKMVIPPRFEQASRFVGGVANVVVGKVKTRINTSGKYIGENRPPEKWTATPVRIIEQHRGSVNAIAFSPDGRYMATASADSTAMIWRDLGKALLVTLRGHKDWVRSVEFVPNKSLGYEQQRLITASRDGTAIIWKMDGTVLYKLEEAGAPLWHAAFSPDGRLAVTAGEDQRVRVYEIGNQASLLTSLDEHQGTVNFVAFSPTGDTLLSASEDGTVRLWSKKENWKLLETLRVGSPVLAARFAPNGRFVAAASKDRMARVWSLRPRLERQFRGHTDWVADVSFSPDNRYLLTTSFDQTARLWSLEGQLLLEIRQHRSVVRAAAFAPDGRHIITASRDRSVRVWEISQF